MWTTLWRTLAERRSLTDLINQLIQATFGAAAQRPRPDGMPVTWQNQEAEMRAAVREAERIFREQRARRSISS